MPRRWSWCAWRVSGACVGAAARGRRSQPITQIAALRRRPICTASCVDDRGQPLAGAVVSALGSTTAFAVSDRDGRFAFRNLPPGPYLVRAHLQGYVPARGAHHPGQRRRSRPSSTIALTRRDRRRASRRGARRRRRPADATGGADGRRTTHDHGEVAWRLRHLKRSVLKDAEPRPRRVSATTTRSSSDSLAGLGRAVGAPARLAIGALRRRCRSTARSTCSRRTSFDRPQDLFAADAGVPRGVAYLSLAAPTGGGDWTMRGAMTQGDLSSWILAGSYVRARRRRAPVRGRAVLRHAALPGRQRRRAGGDVATAAATSASSTPTTTGRSTRAAASATAPSTRATTTSRDRGLLSPRASVTLAAERRRQPEAARARRRAARSRPAPKSSCRRRPASGCRRSARSRPSRAHGASRRSGSITSKLAAEREWAGDFVVGVRAFRQRVDDQLVTLFGVAIAGHGRRERRPLLRRRRPATSTRAAGA